MTEDDYPYQNDDNYLCRYQPQNSAAQITGYQSVTAGDKQLELALVEAGHPVSVAINADSSFRHYHDGIFEDDSCNIFWLNHALLVVGYNKTDPDNAYWIVKN